ncbi:hypothetical protein N7G274_002051 [Stereocaulon virgatum]|uniref:Uncharacterized protein n=1 Tax=Stereocaulon virgatum TaxID=373712 RepID=A0ABR4AQA5_9LECA
MYLALYLLLCSFPITTFASPPLGQVTATATEVLDQLQPNPLLALEPLITLSPAIGENILFGRQALATCGYVSGNGASPLTCPSGYSCTSTIQLMPQWACCNQIECLGNYRMCADYGAELCSFALDAAQCSNIYTSILSCTSDAPSCISYVRSTNIDDTNLYTSLACGQSSKTILALATTTGGKGQAAPSSTLAVGGTAAAVTSFSLGGSAPGSSQGSGQGSNSPPSDNGLSGGAIGGLVVASVAVVVAIIVGWWKRHQVVWFFTCGAYGDRHTVRHQPANHGHQMFGLDGNANGGQGPPVPNGVYNGRPGFSGYRSPQSFGSSGHGNQGGYIVR